MQIATNMKVGGWASIISALALVPLAIFSIYAVFLERTMLLIAIEICANFAYVFVLVIMLLNFRYLLNKYVNETKLDVFISVIIWSNIVITALNVFPILMPSFDILAGIGSIILLIPYGIFFTVFGVKILKLSDSLYGWKRSFSISTIITGISLATVVLMPVGLITSIISDLIMAVIFFKAAKNA